MLTQSERRLKSFGTRQSILIGVKGKKRPGVEADGRGNMEDIKAPMAACNRPQFRDALGDDEHIGKVTIDQLQRMAIALGVLNDLGDPSRCTD